MLGCGVGASLGGLIGGVRVEVAAGRRAASEDLRTVGGVGGEVDGTGAVGGLMVGHGGGFVGAGPERHFGLCCKGCKGRWRCSQYSDSPAFLCERVGFGFPHFTRLRAGDLELLLQAYGRPFLLSSAKKRSILVG